MKNLGRLFLFTAALISVPAASSHARWQGPLVAVGLGPFGPLAPYSYPPYSPVYYSSPPLIQLPGVYSPPRRSAKPHLHRAGAAFTIER